MTHSYIYLPGLVSLDLGGGPIFQTGSASTDLTSTHASGTLYNLTGRATILRDKPYRGSLFYDHLNPVMSIAPGQVINQQNTRYGFDFSLLAPVTPFPVNFDLTRTNNQGRSADRIIDDHTDRLNLRTSGSFGTWGFTQAQYQAAHQESQSGSPNLQIQSTKLDSQSLNVDSRAQFGARKQYDLNNLFYLSSQKYTFNTGALQDRKDLRFLLNLRARHTDALNSYAVFNHGASHQGDLNSSNDSLVAGLGYAFGPDLTTTMSVHNDTSRTGQLSAISRGIDGSVRHQRSLPIGEVQLSYSVRYDLREQRAGAPQTSVIGERATLSGITTVALGHTHVTAGGVTVSNAARTQTFVEGRDYTLIVIGFETRLQRVAGGNILDGEEVLLDYTYDTGGTFSYNQIDQTFNANWRLLRHTNVYFRYLDTAPHLTSGAPSFQLNAVRSSLYGMKSDYPFKLGLEFIVGGSIEREARHETIAPSKRSTADLYGQIEEPLFGAGNFRVSIRRNRVEYENTLQNVNLTAYDARYWARHPMGIDLSANLSHESDRGGVVPRQRLLTSLRGQWRYRKFFLSMEFGHTKETQGQYARTRTLAQVFLKREF